VPVKALTFAALTDASGFGDDLRRFAVEGLGIPWSELEEELLVFQADLWIDPGYDPSVPHIGEYGRDWEGDREEAVRIEYRPRPSAVRFGYVPSMQQWELHYLSPYQPDTFCVHARSERRVTPRRSTPSRRRSAPRR
jgi:hypothetical protein